MSLAAGKLRVLIATTNGPVEVQLLTEEDPVIGRCVACIGGTTETADIAAAYHAFVVRPTGVIEARFGHPCYRLDVSGRIDAGSSWQLGVFVAHALRQGKYVRFVRIEYDLQQSLTIAQVDENDAAMIATTLGPAGHGDGLSDR